MRNRNTQSRLFRSALLAALLLGAGASCSDHSSPEKLMAEAKLLKQKGQQKSAIIQLKNLLEIQPQNADARLFLGELYLETGSPDLAEIELQKALSGKADRPTVYLAWAKSLLERGEYKKLLSLQPELAPQLAQDPDWLAMKAHGLADSGKIDEAKAEYERLLREHPDHVPSQLGLARLSVRATDYAAANKQIDAVLKRSPNDADALQMKAEMFRREGDSKNAEMFFKQTLKADPNRIDVMVNLAVMALEQNNETQAKQMLADLRKFSPDNPLASYVESIIAFHQQKYDAAWDLIQTPLKTHYQYPGVRTLAGGIALRKGLYQQAETLLSPVLEANPRSVKVRLLMVGTLLGSAQSDRALDLLMPMIAANVTIPEVYILAGEAAMQSQDYQLAAGYLAKAAKLTPTNLQLRTRLAVSKLAAGDAGSGFEELRAIAGEDKKGAAAELAMASAYIGRKQYSEALQVLDVVEKKLPSEAAAWQMRASIYLAQGERAKAREQLELSLKARPNFLPAVNTLAELDGLEKHFDRGQKRYEALLALEPGNIQATMMLADYLAAQPGKLNEAISLLEKAHKDKPEAFEPVLGLTRLYIQAGNPKQALAVAQDAAARRTGDANALDNLGQAQVAAGSLNQALATYQALVQLQPKSALAHFRLGYVKNRLGQTDSALAEFGQAIQLNPLYAEAYVHTATILQAKGRYAEMDQLAKNLQKKFPKAPAGYQIEADSLGRQGKFLAAADAYRKAYELAPNGDLAVKLHFVLHSAGNLPAAEKALADWTDKHPNDSTIKLYLAEMALKEKDYKRAIELFEAADKLRPNSPILLNNLAWAYMEAKDPRALATAQRARTLSGDAPLVIDTLASILLATGKSAEAIEMWQKALEKSKDQPVLALHLAQAYVQIGDIPKARATLRPILLLEPSTSEWKQAKVLADSLQGR